MLEDERSRRLFEHGLRDFGRRFDGELGMVRLETDLGARHDPRGSLWYALALLLSDGPEAEVAERAIATVTGMQETAANDPHRGNFRWLYEDEVVTDLNAVEFVLEGLVHILLRAGNRLSEELTGRVHESMRLAFSEVERLDVHWTYSNIYLLDVHNSILGGELLNDGHIRERGVQRLRRWAELTRHYDAPHEFNSPTYSAVQITALAAIAQHSRDEAARGTARRMEEFVWRHVARHFHPPTLQLAGPHSRAYRRDVAGASGFLKVLLYKLLGEPRLLDDTPYYSGPAREGDIAVALTEYHCPTDALDMFVRPDTREVRERASGGVQLVTYLTPLFALGTMSRPYGVGEPPELWPQHNSCLLRYVRPHPPGYGVLYCRYLVDDRRTGPMRHESGRTAVDLWDEGLFRCAQRAGQAIVAYGLLPRGQRPLSSLRLDVRLLGPDAAADVLTAGGPYRHGATVELPPGEPLALADGDAYIGLIPLTPSQLGHEAPIVLWRDGEETVLSIYNYRGPAKSFWEYRSLAGPFFKGNVLNGFVVSVAPQSDWASLSDFLAALRSTPLTDELIGSSRVVRFGEGAGALSLEYDLRDLRP